MVGGRDRMGGPGGKVVLQVVLGRRESSYQWSQGSARGLMSGPRVEGKVL